MLTEPSRLQAELEMRFGYNLRRVALMLRTPKDGHEADEQHMALVAVQELFGKALRGPWSAELWEYAERITKAAEQLAACSPPRLIVQLEKGGE